MRKVLDDYLSRALDVKLIKDRISIINESNYVLTLDYAIKMLNIHERYKCGVPVIIEGETGVGKTFLVEMLSKLWNQSHLLNWKTKKEGLLEFFKDELAKRKKEEKITDEDHQVTNKLAKKFLFPLHFHSLMCLL